jgi:hypothetical protein
MHDRARFWWNSLSRGVSELYDAAGWVGLVVLVLGVGAGIAVPLVFSLSPWLTAVVLLGLFLVVMAEGTYHVWHEINQQRLAALNERDATKTEIEDRFAALRYSLEITNLDPRLINDPTSMQVQIGIQIENTSAEYVRYEIESVSTSIAGRRSADEFAGTRTGIIPPSGSHNLMPPPAIGVPFDWELGSMSLAILYGHASGSLRYRRRWEYAVQAMRQIGSRQNEISTVNLVPVAASEVEDI